MTSKQTVRLLLLHHSQDDAELLINSIRNSGKATRAELVASEDEFTAALKNTWDIIVVSQQVAGISAEGAIDLVLRMGKDVPIIVVLESHDEEKVAELMKKGARDAIVSDARPHMLAAINRELDNLAVRRRVRELEMDLQEAEHRVSLLLQTSQDAVAYVTDGMHIHANEAYVQLFGYGDPDDLAGMPIMDMITDGYLDELKKLLKIQHTEGASAELGFEGIREDGSNFKGTMYLSQATYEEEPCIQIMIRAEAAPVTVGVDSEEMEARLREAQHTDPATGLRNKIALLEAANGAIARSAREQQASSMFYVQVDQYQQHRATLGIEGCDAMIKAIGEALKPIAKDHGQIFRASDSSLALTHDETDFKAVQGIAENIRKTIDAAVIDIPGKSIHVTVCVGAAIISENITSGQMMIDRVIKMASDAFAEKKEGNAAKTYDPAADIPADEDLSLSEHLKKAIEENQFTLLFQPIINLNDENAQFFEVSLNLARGEEKLNHEAIYQGAAGGKLVGKLDRWVILNSVKRLADYTANGNEARLLIGLGADSIHDAKLVEWIGSVLKAAKLKGDALCIQMDESDVSAALTPAAALVEAARLLAIKSAINKFGCDIRPMKILQNVNVDMLKLDASYTQDLGNTESRETTSKLVSELRELGKETIATHIETAMDMSNVYQIGVTYIQGSMLQAPAPKFTNE